MSLDSRATRHLYAQIWLVIFCSIVFAVFVGIDRHYIGDMFAVDTSRLSVFISLVFFGACGHAAWHIFQTSSRLAIAQSMLTDQKQISPEGNTSDSHSVFLTPAQYVDGFVSQVLRSKTSQPGEGSMVLEVYADRARSTTEIGWYVVDILIRLGLIGTIVGFILILGALSDGPEPTADNIQSLLISMSGGMGVALYTTLAGLVTATLAGLQYMVLGRCVERLIGVLMALEEAVPTWKAQS